VAETKAVAQQNDEVMTYLRYLDGRIGRLQEDIRHLDSLLGRPSAQPPPQQQQSRRQGFVAVMSGYGIPILVGLLATVVAATIVVYLFWGSLI
jgi:hypothetical protein